MENKVVCDYCGTIYDGSREKCPLCGSTTRAEAAPAAPRRRLTEEERKARRRTQQEEQRAQQDAQRARREEDRQARLEERRRVPQKQRSSKAPETQGGIPARLSARRRGLFDDGRARRAVLHRRYDRLVARPGGCAPGDHAERDGRRAGRFLLHLPESDARSSEVPPPRTKRCSCRSPSTPAASSPCRSRARMRASSASPATPL